jgi:hypothetical protein
MLDREPTTRRSFTRALAAGLMGDVTLLFGRNAPAQKAPKKSV